MLTKLNNKSYIIIFFFALIIAKNSYANIKNNFIKSIKIEFIVSAIDSIKDIRHAEYPGETSEMFVFLYQKLQVKKSDFEDGIKTKLHIKFTVQKSGKLKDIEVVEGISKKIDNKVIQIFKEMPNWIPASNNNIPIEKTYVLPIIIEFK